LSELSQLFDQLKAFERPPVEKWHPDKTVEFDLRILRNGDWVHEGGLISRRKLVKLFSTVLALRDADYYLVTPQVRYLIQVEDAPFLGVELTTRNSDSGRNPRNQEIFIRTNMDEVVRVDAAHPLNVITEPKTQEPSPYVDVRDGLLARLTRPVFYELADMSQCPTNDPNEAGVYSAGKFFPLG